MAGVFGGCALSGAALAPRLRLCWTARMTLAIARVGAVLRQVRAAMRLAGVRSTAPELGWREIATVPATLAGRSSAPETASHPSRASPPPPGTHFDRLRDPAIARRAKALPVFNIAEGLREAGLRGPCRAVRPLTSHYRSAHPWSVRAEYDPLVGICGGLRYARAPNAVVSDIDDLVFRSRHRVRIDGLREMGHQRRALSAITRQRRLLLACD